MHETRNVFFNAICFALIYVIGKCRQNQSGDLIF
jgi:hypothetical protein